MKHGGCINNGNTAHPFRLFCRERREHKPLAKVDRKKQPKEKMLPFSNMFSQKTGSGGEDVDPWWGYSHEV